MLVIKIILIPLYILIVNFGLWMRYEAFNSKRDNADKYFSKLNIVVHIVATIVAIGAGIGLILL